MRSCSKLDRPAYSGTRANDDALPALNQGPEAGFRTALLSSPSTQPIRLTVEGDESHSTELNRDEIEDPRPPDW